nr:piggyBac transposable element-derived protein 4-like [Hydra vulgaris]
MPKHFGLGESVLYQLTKPLHGKHHQVYFDNYFTTVPLMEYLLQHEVYCCGTIRSDRKYLPKNLKSDKMLQSGDFDYGVSAGRLVFYKWKDNKSVTILCNFHGTEHATVLRTQKDGTRKDFNCPISVKHYNTFIGGVDMVDQLISSYGLSWKTKKWWHQIFFGLIERALCNSFIAFNKITGAKMKSLLYRRMVAQSLITRGRLSKVGRPLISLTLQGPLKKRKSLTYSVSSAIRKENLGVHWPKFDSKRGHCEVCAQEKRVARPHIKCSACEVYLCLIDKKNCFAEYHEL